MELLGEMACLRYNSALCIYTPVNRSKAAFWTQFPLMSHSLAFSLFPIHLLLLKEQAWHVTSQKTVERQVSDLLQLNTVYCLKGIVSKNPTLLLRIY